nr:MAG: hypothetical protein [Bacteriophage sp.]
MSTFILEVQFIDAQNCSDKEFNALEEILAYLTGYNESDFEWLALHDEHNNMDVEGWSEIHRYIRENTGPVLPVHELDADAWDWITKETADLRSIMNESASETLCNAPCDAVSETSTNVSPDAPLPRVERFSDLPDGTEFYIAQTYAYGGRQLYQKVASNNGLHNAVLCTDSYSGIRVNDLQLVIRK